MHHMMHKQAFGYTHAPYNRLILGRLRRLQKKQKNPPTTLLPALRTTLPGYITQF